MRQLADFLDDYKRARAKTHGQGRPVREAVFLALCCRAIRLRRPMTHPMFGQPWRWFFGNAAKLVSTFTPEQRNEE